MWTAAVGAALLTACAASLEVSRVRTVCDRATYMQPLCVKERRGPPCGRRPTCSQGRMTSPRGLRRTSSRCSMDHRRHRFVDCLSVVHAPGVWCMHTAGAQHCSICVEPACMCPASRGCCSVAVVRPVPSCHDVRHRRHVLLRASRRSVDGDVLRTVHCGERARVQPATVCAEFGLCATGATLWQLFHSTRGRRGPLEPRRQCSLTAQPSTPLCSSAPNV